MQMALFLARFNIFLSPDKISLNTFSRPLRCRRYGVEQTFTYIGSESTPRRILQAPDRNKTLQLLLCMKLFSRMRQGFGFDAAPQHCVRGEHTYTALTPRDRVQR